MEDKLVEIRGNVLIINMKPFPAPRMVRSDKWKKRPCVMHYHAFRDELQLALRKAKFEFKGQLHIEFYLQMPKGWSAKKKKEMLGMPHTVKPDIDNLVKAFMDSFRKNDSFVYRLHTAKWWADKNAIAINLDTF